MRLFLYGFLCGIFAANTDAIKVGLAANCTNAGGGSIVWDKCSKQEQFYKYLLFCFYRFKSKTLLI